MQTAMSHRMQYNHSICKIGTFIVSLLQKHLKNQNILEIVEPKFSNDAPE
jgi:hypothetical protein